MKKVLFLAAGLALASGLWAQPKPKSQKEVDALMAIQQAATPDAQIAAVENLLTKFADTEFKAMALQMAVQAAQQKGDQEKMVVYAERALKEDPKNFMVVMMLSQSIVQKTRSSIWTKKRSWKRAEKYATDGIEIPQDRRQAAPI
jgi:hypothetical protein